MRPLIFVLLTVCIVGSVSSRSIVDSIFGHHGCAGGFGMVDCFIDPCMMATCNAPGAICRSNYCHGCYADWEDISGKSIPCGGGAIAS